MSNSRIGIVGYGFVGRHMHKLLGDSAVTLDLDSTDEQKDAINACQMVLLCVPTPTCDGGACDVSAVEECVEWISGPIIVIRSTVAPGTTDRLRRQTGKPIVFQPEYVGETVQHPLLDVSKRSFIILGGRRAECVAVSEIYQQYYHSEVQFHFTDAVTAEVAKYMAVSYTHLRAHET